MMRNASISESILRIIPFSYISFLDIKYANICAIIHILILMHNNFTAVQWISILILFEMLSYDLAMLHRLKQMVYINIKEVSSR